MSEISDTSKLIKLECFLCPNWCASMVVHAWQHAQKCRNAGTVVNNSCSLRFAVPCWWFHFVPRVMRNEEADRRSV